MTNDDKIIEMLAGIQKDISTMKTDISGLKADVEELKTSVSELKEEHAITRDGVNTLIAWADRVAVVVKMPLQ